MKPTCLVFSFFFVATVFGAKLQKLPVHIPNANVVEFDGGSRFLVATLDGQVFSVKNKGSYPMQRILDWRPSTASGSERGLLGMALHPDFAKRGAWGNGRLYLHYSSSKRNAGDHDHIAVISEFRMHKGVPKTIDPKSERVLLTVPQPQGNHNGGDLEFGPDSMLYIALGDGGASFDRGFGHNRSIGNSQDLTNLLGKILRIDVHGKPYKIPKDNPFYGQKKKRPEIFAYGLRNVYRMGFDETGRLWAGDVGQNTWEEVNVVKNGGNYGWRIKEGFKATSGVEPSKQNLPMEDPVLQYANPSHGRSVIGGYVYRGKALPSLKGVYIFGDFYRNHLFTTQGKGIRVLNNLEMADSLSDIAEDPQGELYFSSLGGSLYMLRP